MTKREETALICGEVLAGIRHKNTTAVLIQALKKERKMSDRLAEALRPMEIIADDHFAKGKVQKAKNALSAYDKVRK